MKNKILNILITGIFLFIPVFVVGLVVAHSVAAIRTVLSPIASTLGLERAIDIVALNALAITILVGLILLLGVIAQVPWISRKVKKMDGGLVALLPGYAFVRSGIGGVFKEEQTPGHLKPVMVFGGSTAQIGYEVERTGNGCVTVFMPGVPNPRSGSAKVFPEKEVTHLDIPPHKVAEIVKRYGKGAAKLADQYQLD